MGYILGKQLVKKLLDLLHQKGFSDRLIIKSIIRDFCLDVSDEKLGAMKNGEQRVLYLFRRIYGVRSEV